MASPLLQTCETNAGRTGYGHGQHQQYDGYSEPLVARLTKIDRQPRIENHNLAFPHTWDISPPTTNQPMKHRTCQRYQPTFECETTHGYTQTSRSPKTGAMSSDIQDETLPTANAGNDKAEPEQQHPGRFKFKSKRRTRDEKSAHSDGDRRHRDDDEERKQRQDDDGERKHRHHHHRSKRRRRSPSLDNDTPPSPKPHLDPETAFRESLFDAMADDEGAQFWEGVYGQPIHTYPDVKAGPTGELERMTDEEYTAFVRAKMYEKTHQHLIEERARREEVKKERARVAREGAREEREAEGFRRRVEESLRRGEERKGRRVWGERWERYVAKWEMLGKGERVAIASIPWPVESGKRNDITAKEIERFFLHAPTSGQPNKAQLREVLKLERVRWHPDKIQQKLGGQDVSEDVIQAVTEVFQVIDRMWSEVRDKKP